MSGSTSLIPFHERKILDLLKSDDLADFSLNMAGRLRKKNFVGKRKSSKEGKWEMHRLTDLHEFYVSTFIVQTA